MSSNFISVILAPPPPFHKIMNRTRRDLPSMPGVKPTLRCPNWVTTASSSSSSSSPLIGAYLPDEALWVSTLTQTLAISCPVIWSVIFMSNIFISVILAPPSAEYERGSDELSRLDSTQISRRQVEWRRSKEVNYAGIRTSCDEATNSVCRSTRVDRLDMLGRYMCCSTSVIKASTPYLVNAFTLSDFPFITAATILRSVFGFWYYTTPNVSSMFSCYSRLFPLSSHRS